jgi:prolyl-tRNA editing enzyme YbaK/EbsC (Cys-tRNA(Pro) deacylase)
MRTSKELQSFIDQHNLQAEILFLTEDTPTVPDAARALGTTAEQIIKSLVFLVSDEPILVIANGTRKIDSRKLGAHFGVGRKRAKLAPAEMALDITGYIVGSMPPFGHESVLPTYIDPKVMDLSLLYGGGGDVHAMMKLTSTHLLEVTQGELLDLVEDE